MTVMGMGWDDENEDEERRKRENGDEAGGRGIWKVRGYGEKVGDYQMISEWREGHKVSQMPESIIPPLAVIAERDGQPMAFASCYQSFGIGVCFLEWLTTRPGLSVPEAKLALGHVINAIKECTSETHKLMLGYCHPAIARASREFGFLISTRNCCQVVSRTDRL